MRLKMKLGVIVSLVVAIGVGVLVYISYSSSSDALRSQSIEISKKTSSSVSSQIDTTFKGIIQVLITYANSFDAQSGDWGSVSESMKSYVGDNKSLFYYAFAGDTSGEVNTTDGKTKDIKNKEYFKKTIKLSNVKAIIDKDEDNGRYELVICVPSMMYNAIQGIIGIAIRLDKDSFLYEQVVTKGGIGKKGYGFLLDGNGTILLYPDEKQIFKMYKSLSKGNEKLDKAFKRSLKEKEGFSEYAFGGKDRFFAWETSGIDNLKVYSSGYMNELNAPIKKLMKTLLLYSVALIGVIVVILLLTLNPIVKEISKVSSQAKELARGNLRIILNSKRKDEIGALMNQLDASVKGINNLLSQSKNATFEVDKRLNEFEDALNSLLTQQEGIVESVDSVNEAINSISSSSEEASAGIEEIASGSQDAVRSIQDTKKNTEQIKGLAQKNRIEAGEAQQVIQKVNEDALNANTAMEELEISSKKIEEIITTISSIAEQTNLLALNAAIEAARAGEAGKGFAVVAEEIRNLADETKKATEGVNEVIEEIRQRVEVAVKAITNTRASVEESVKKVEDIRKGIEESVELVGNVDSMMENISSVSEEQGASSEEMASAVDVITKSISDVSAKMEAIVKAVEGQRKVSEGIKDAFEGLRENQRRLMEEIDKFQLLS
ncbi:MAG: methyl-accepting chemotaxis protein [Candidatus Syntropharchaeia archaeon]